MEQTIIRIVMDHTIKEIIDLLDKRIEESKLMVKLNEKGSKDHSYYLGKSVAYGDIRNKIKQQYESKN